MSETPSGLNLAPVSAERLSAHDRARAFHILGRAYDDMAALSLRAMSVTLQNSPKFGADEVQGFLDTLEAMTPELPHEASWPDSDLLGVLQSRAAVICAGQACSVHMTGVNAVSIRLGETAAFAGAAANDLAGAGPVLLTGSDVSALENFGPSVSLRDLPLRVSDKLLSAHSEDIACTLIIEHDVPAQSATDLSSRANARAFADICAHTETREAFAQCAAAMAKAGRLTAALIARLACGGQMRFAEYGLAARAGISPAKASLMMYAPGDMALSELLRAACIGRLDSHLLRGAIMTYRHLENSGAEYDKAYFQRLMIHRVLTLEVNFSDEDGDYLLEALDGLGVSEFY